jgi:hypothetical protein
MRRLLILACSAIKKKSPGHIPAIERYQGPLWQTLRVVDPLRRMAFASVLSARVGWKPATEGITDYEQRLTPDRARELREGGLAEPWPKFKGAMSGGNAAHWLAAEARNGGAFDDVCIAGGKDYVELAHIYCIEAAKRGYFAPGWQCTIINAQIGLMRKALREWLVAPDEAKALEQSYQRPRDEWEEADRRGFTDIPPQN